MSAQQIHLENVARAYGAGEAQVRAVDALDLDIGRGDFAALAGPSGSGKSTFLLHLNGLIEGSGKISVMGRELDHSDKKLMRSVRADVGLIFQDADDQLFSGTVGDDVAFGPIHMGLDEDEVKRRVASALGAVFALLVLRA